MKTIFKIFELKEISIRNQWGSQDDEYAEDLCVHVRLEWDVDFETEGQAESFLKAMFLQEKYFIAKFEIVKLYVKQ